MSLIVHICPENLEPSEVYISGWCIKLQSVKCAYGAVIQFFQQYIYINLFPLVHVTHS